MLSPLMDKKDVTVNSWHAKSGDEIFHELKTSEKGLNQGEAEKRLMETGLNEISKKKKTSPILIFLKQFNSPLIYIFLLAMISCFIVVVFIVA